MFDDKSNTQVLQKYVLSKSDKNSVIKCSWTPTVMTIERRTNINSIKVGKSTAGNKAYETNTSLTIGSPSSNELKKPSMKLYEHIVTYEGPDHMSNSEKVYSSFVIKDIQGAINSITDHLEQQEIALSNAVFYFKYDRHDDLNLLFATNIS